MKNIITTAVIFFSITSFAQVGINNTSPKATLDITAKTAGTKPEGLIIPQLAGDDIRTATAAGVYGTNQKGLIIYASSADTAPTGATANITIAGYYYFDGTNWQKISTGNTVSTSLASGNILVGNASNVATAVAPSGDVTISNTGVATIAANAVTTSKIANNAVTVAKLPAGATATTFLRGDGTWVTPTDTNTTYTGSTSIGLNGTSFERAALTGDITASANSNATTIAANAVTTSKIANNAVTVAKLPAGATATTFLRGDGTWVTPTDTNTTYIGSTSINLNGTSFERTALTGDVTASANSNTTSVVGIQGRSISNTAPTTGQVLGWNGTNWIPSTDANTTYTGSTSINLNGTSFERTALTGDVTASANSNATTIAANAVTSAKIADGTVANADLANMAALSVKGNATNGTAAPTDIAAGTDGYVLRRSGTTLGFGTVDTAGITDGAVTTNKILDATVANADLNTGVGGIYKGSGSLAGNTTVAQGGSTLAFTSTATNGFSVDGTTLSVDAANNKVGIGTAAPITTLDTRQNPGNASPGSGAIAIGETSQIASAAGPGAIRYSTNSGGTIEYSNGTSWNTLTSTPKKTLVYGYLTSGQTVNNGNGTFAVTEEFDQNNDFASNIFTVPRNGNYFITVCALTNYQSWSGGNEFSIRAYKNGIPQVVGFWMAPSSASWYGGTCTSVAIAASAGDQITFVYYNSGSAKTLTSGDFNKFSIQEL